MKSFLAFCESPDCGAVFEVPNIVGGDGNVNIHMSGSKAGPCPVCGSFGFIPDGVYQYANQTIDFLTGPETSINILKQVHEILKKGKTNESTKDEILKEVAAVSPKTAEVLKKAPNTQNVLQWIMTVIALIALAIQIHTSYFKGDDVEQQFREHLLEENKKLRELNNKSEPYKRQSPKIERNAPCPCGSGKKFKKCCRLTMV